MRQSATERMFRVGTIYYTNKSTKKKKKPACKSSLAHSPHHHFGFPSYNQHDNLSRYLYKCHFIYFKLLFSDKKTTFIRLLCLSFPLNCGLLLSLSSSPPPPLSSCQNNPPSPPQQQQHYYLLYCSTETCTIGWEKRKRERDRERERMNREQFELSMVVCSIIKTKSTSTQFPFCLLEQ